MMLKQVLLLQETGAAWKATSSAVSVGDVANNVTRQITSVAAGTDDSDAVNVAQLKKAEEKINDVEAEAKKTYHCCSRR